MSDADKEPKATSPHNIDSAQWLTLEELESEKQKYDIEERETQQPSRDALKSAIEVVVGKMNNAAGGATHPETQDNNAEI